MPECLSGKDLDESYIKELIMSSRAERLPTPLNSKADESGRKHRKMS